MQGGREVNGGLESPGDYRREVHDMTQQEFPLTVLGQRLPRQISFGGDEELLAEVLEWILAGQVLGVLAAVVGEGWCVWGGLAAAGGGMGFGHCVCSWC